jgi:hypothetical protein
MSVNMTAQTLDITGYTPLNAGGIATNLPGGTPITGGPNPIPLLNGTAVDRANALASAPANPYSYTGTIGIGDNLVGPAYWETPAFNDLRRQSDSSGRDLAGWYLYNAVGAVADDTGNLLALASGTADKILIHNSESNYGGDYVVKWNQAAGPSADINLKYAGQGTLTLVEDDSANGRKVYNLNFNPGMTPDDYRNSSFRIELVAPFSSDLDWHVILPGCEALHDTGDVFNPHYVEDFQRSSIVRFLNWTQTNSSQMSVPSDLATISSGTWIGGPNVSRGVPYNVCVQFAKKVGAAGCWINIPHLSTSEMLDAIAAEVYSEWVPGLTIYIEFSNEIWNSIFQQTHYARAQGDIDYPHLGGLLSREGSWIAQKSIEMKQAFVAAFGANADAIKLVVAGHSHQENGYISTEYNHYSRFKNNENDIVNHVDVASVAAYFNGNLNYSSWAETNGVDGWTDEQFETHLQPDSDDVVSRIQTWIFRLDTVIGLGDIPFFLYECGQHLQAVTSGSAIDERYQLFNASPAMGSLYQYHIQSLINAGVDHITEYRRHGRKGAGMYFGMTSGIHDPISHKAMAVEAARS